MSPARLPVSAATAVTFHAGIFGLYFYFAHNVKKENLRVIGNVDLLVQVRKPAALPPPMPKAATPPSTWNFLKMALPAVPKIALPQTMNIKVPETRKPLIREPEKLQDRGRLEAAPKLEALDLGRRRVDGPLVAQKIEMKSRTAALASAPRLEEVGVRKVRNLPAAIALEERRQEAVAMQRIEAIAPSSRRAPSAAQAVLREASPMERSRLGEKITSFLPEAERIELQPARVETLKTVKPALSSAAPARQRGPAEVLETKKKSVEIEGPLADRKIIHYEVPAFPSWAKDQGMLEAAVAIRFTVNREGDVLEGMRVESTSGYGRLDRMAMDALKKWKFAPIGVDQAQWGIITFKFVLE